MNEGGTLPCWHKNHLSSKSISPERGNILDTFSVRGSNASWILCILGSDQGQIRNPYIKTECSFNGV